MAEVSTGLRGLLGRSGVYRLWNVLAGAPRLHRLLIEAFIQPVPGERILDVGCGTADILGELPDSVSYTGFDVNPRYVAAAHQRYGDRAHILHGNVTADPLEQLAPFDVVLALGVLHHLDDNEALSLFSLARSALKPEGRLVTYDACHDETSSTVARWLISCDRGQSIRTPTEYAELAQGCFDSIASETLNGHLRIPYTCSVLVCRAPKVCQARCASEDG